MRHANGTDFEFTVLMAVYHRDRPHLFERAVRSAFENSLRPCAFLLVVDGPVGPRLKETILRLVDEFSIDLLCLKKNCGLAMALNAGLSMIETAWVVRADADDENLLDRFEKLAAAVKETPSLDIVGGQIVEIDEDEKEVGIRSVPCEHEEILKFARLRNPFNHMTVAYRLSMVRSCGGYPDIPLREDYGLWARMLGAGAKAKNVQSILVRVVAGRGLYERRGGLSYAMGEFHMQRHLARCGLKSKSVALRDFFSRASVFVLPARFRRVVYERFLRRDIEGKWLP